MPRPASFVEAVLAVVDDIPPGEVATYGDIAALLGSRELAIKALSLHPLVPSVTTARSIFDGYRERLPALQEAFA